MSEATIQSESPEAIRLVLGERDRHRRMIRDATGVEIVLRGGEVRLFGDETDVAQCRAVFDHLLTLADTRGRVDESDVFAALGDRISRKPAVATGTTSDRQMPATRNRMKMSPVDEASSDTTVGSATDQAVDLHERGRQVFAKTPGQQLYLDAMGKNDLVFCVGPAGSGKTYLAVAAAIQALRTEQVRKIVLVRPAVEAGEKLGFLPGDMLAKVNPYLRPLLDALNDMIDFEHVQRYMARDVVEIVPLAFMRGRTLNDTFIILDEAQNSTVTQMKMFLTRMGERSRVVVTGDTTQLDLPDDVPSGLLDATRRLGSIAGVSVVRLERADIVRHRLVREIVHAYDPAES
ncbi:PhoH family protein [Stratiformator vulcanicus]|uniref:PhoH-like protein n=1 Tax=Stratiformator vulcanicus TaxID=2527980 RepID=A0A517R6K1_9PLAN|nr:PhoH family protein [Stratiformator vulcanicus]QDT39508.1 PhoH-like protein [Stratiformator vulcanicus]